jgi:cytochrome c biogenesis protein ResB
MIARTSRDPWQVIWHVATGDGLLTVLLLGVAVALVIAVWLPQERSDDPAAYAQWLSQVQARFGSVTSMMQTLGLFTTTRSLGFRTLLAILAGCLLLRLIESGDRMRLNREMGRPVAGAWQSLAGVRMPEVMGNLRCRHYRLLAEPPLLQADRWPWADLFPLLAHVGAILLLAGLLLYHLWGWREVGLILQDGEQVPLREPEAWVALGEGNSRVTHSPGIVTSVEERGPGVRASAADSAGRPLSLHGTSDTALLDELTFALTEDQYFAIPEAQLVVRLTRQSGGTIHAHSPVLIQVYRSPPGQLVTEAVAEGEAELTVDEVTLQFAGVPYVRVAATFNLGRWPTAAGVVLLLGGLLGSIAWPSRRFWLREEAEVIAGAGDLPRTQLSDHVAQSAD